MISIMSQLTPDRFIGKSCGFKISHCGQEAMFVWPFADGSLPDGFIEALVDSAEINRFDRVLLLSVVAKDDHSNRQTVCIYY